MKKFLIILSITLFASLVFAVKQCRTNSDERLRLSTNQRSLIDGVRYYRTRDSLSAASVERLELSFRELKRYQAQLIKAAQTVGVKPSAMQSASTTATTANYSIATVLQTTAHENGKLDSGSMEKGLNLTSNKSINDKIFKKEVNYATPYIKISGTIFGDTLKADITTYDTLVHIIHRVPRQFIFFRWGTKAVRQEVISKNPHSQITYTQYIELHKKNRD